MRRTFGTLLQGASNDDGGSEEAMEGGLVAGHAYSINKVKKSQITGEVLVQLRNPWGGHEWQGAWCDSDPRWNSVPGLKEEMGQTDRDDGMFWMDIDDFGAQFTNITFVDIPDPSHCVFRAESKWSGNTAGGVGKHWKKNPQLMMVVKKKSHITIALNQPDTRMQFSHVHMNGNPLTTDDFYHLYADQLIGYEYAMIFHVFKGSERKTSQKKPYAVSSYSETRTLSIVMEDVEPGEYVIVPALEEAGVELDFR